MWVDHDLSLHFLLKEHLIRCAEVSLLEIILVGAMSKEKVVGDSFSEIVYKLISGRWHSNGANDNLKTRRLKSLLVILSNSFCSFSA